MNALLLRSSPALLLRRPSHVGACPPRFFLSSTTKPTATSSSSSTAARPSGEPKFKIQVHLLAFAVIMLPVVIYAIYADRHKLDEETLEEELKTRYPAAIAANARQNEAMKELFRNTIQNPEAGVEDERLQEVLYGGWGRNQKRFHEVDKELYGTKEGVELAKKTQEELQQEAQTRKERRKRKKKKKGAVAPAAEEVESPTKQQVPNAFATSKLKGIADQIDTKQVATVAIVGSLAAAAGFFLGGGRRSQ